MTSTAPERIHAATALEGQCIAGRFASLVGTPVPHGPGGYRLALNGAVRREAGGVEAGDDVAMSLGPAPPHPIPNVLAELAGALACVRGGRLAFEAWPPSRRLGLA